MNEISNMSPSAICAALRNKYPRFFYHNYEVNYQEFKEEVFNTLIIDFFYEIEGLTEFKSTFHFPCPKTQTLDLDSLEPFIFNLGLIELLSYWKVTCSPEIVIKPKKLDNLAINFWENLFYLGLGEFRYKNSIDLKREEFLKFSFADSVILHTGFSTSETKSQGLLIPVGGGKDSIVTLNLLKNYKSDSHIFLLNPRLSSLKTAEVAGFSKDKVINVKRVLDPRLIKLNSEGFLNGHTPFSALLAFSSALSAKIYNKEHIVLSNESSASEANLAGTDINHQYSKSLQFESDFRSYLNTYLANDIYFFSFLRPLNELQIAKIFSKLTLYHPVFKSCNLGHYTDTWCGKCSKCLFTAIMLAPFIKKVDLMNIFSKDIFSDLELLQTTKELFSEDLIKPFECVGTRSEVASALNFLSQDPEYKNSAIISRVKEFLPLATADISTVISEYNNDHFIPADFLAIIMENLNALRNE